MNCKNCHDMVCNDQTSEDPVRFRSTEWDENRYGDVNSLCIIDAIKEKNSWLKNIMLEGKSIKFKLDSGADVNVLPYRYLKELNIKNEIKRCSITLQSFGGYKIKPVGMIEAEVETGGKIALITFVVVNHKNTIPILGLDSCIKLNLIQRVDNLKYNNDDLESEKQKIYTKNKDVFEGLGCFPDVCRIRLQDDARPTVSSARRIPLKIKDKFHDTLELLENKGIIKRVEEPVDWVNNVVIVEKPNGSLRVCIDPTELNKHIILEKYTIPTIAEIAPKLANKSHFSILDLKDGFYQVPLDENSSKLCSFSTIFGTYRFKRAPFGLSCMPEIFQRLVFKYFGDIEGVTVYFDDLCISSNSKEENDAILGKVFERARKFNVKFNFDKFQYCKSKVKYLGVIFSKEGMSPDPDKLKAVQLMEIPKNKNELQKLLGMINYLRNFIPNLSERISPFRDLLKKNVIWEWTDTHNRALSDLKSVICSSQVLASFDPAKIIEIQCDASKNALGFCMLQEGKPVHFGSRSLNNAELEYAQVEKELLAICFATSKLHNYIYRHQDVIVFTDHLPLISIINKPLNRIVNNRLRRLKLKLIDYQFKIKYLPGKHMYIADYLSRCGNKMSQPKDALMDDYIHAIGVNEIDFDEPWLKRFQQETKNDQNLKLVKEYLENVWPKRTLCGEIKHYHTLRNDLLIDNDLIYFNDRLIVPSSLRKHVLTIIHETHLGVAKTVKKMKQNFYWPGMVSDVTNMSSACLICQKFAKSKTKAPLNSHDIPNKPFMKIGIDIADYRGTNYLVIVDYFSRWIEAIKITSKSSTTIIHKLKEVFSRFGIPKTVISDNVPLNSQEFKHFSCEWGFEIVTSSPYYPKSNGLAEKGVGIVKNMLKKCHETKGDLQLYLLNYRNSPVANLDVSPSELLNSRLMRSRIPMREDLLKPRVVPVEVYQKMIENQTQQKFQYNKTSRKCEESFSKGEPVWVQDSLHGSWEEGEVIEKLQAPRSYLIKMKNGSIRRRNEIHLRKRKVTND